MASDPRKTGDGAGEPAARLGRRRFLRYLGGIGLVTGCSLDMSRRPPTGDGPVAVDRGSGTDRPTADARAGDRASDVLAPDSRVQREQPYRDREGDRARDKGALDKPHPTDKLPSDKPPAPDLCPACGSACVASCGGVCASACITSCSAACGTGCTGGCGSGCSVACASLCTGACTGGCATTCGTSGCTGGCTAGCASDCTGSCKSSCASSCSLSCVVGCNAACTSVSA